MQASLLSPGFAALNPGYEKTKNKNKAGGTPADATHQIRTIRVRRAPKKAGRAAPTGVPPRFLRQRTNAAAQLQTRFLGRNFGGRYSASVCPSPAIQSQTG